MPNADPAVIKDKARLAVLHRLELLDSPTEEAFDRLTRLASKIIGAPISLITLIDADRQFFKSQIGLPEPFATKRGSSLSQSFCQHVVASNEPLIINDTREHPLTHDNLAVPALNIISYLGMPLTTQNGAGLGSLCVVDNKPRVWMPEEIEIVRELALSVMTEIELRAELLARREAEQALQDAYFTLDARNQSLSRLTEFCRFTVDHLIEVVQRNADKREVLDYLSMAQHELDRQTA